MICTESTLAFYLDTIRGNPGITHSRICGTEDLVKIISSVLKLRRLQKEREAQ